MTESELESSCADFLEELLDALRAQAPHLNERLPYPDRMAIIDVRFAQIRAEEGNGCSTVLTVKAVAAPKSYKVYLALEGDAIKLTICDKTDFEESFTLATRPGEPLQDDDVRSLYDAINTDIAGHFGTDS